MASNSLADFQYRMQEVDALLGQGFQAVHADEACMYAKSAVVFAAAALERYMNDVLEEICTDFQTGTWDCLGEGRKRYLLRHIALEMVDRAGAFSQKKPALPSDSEHLKDFIQTCASALDDPSTWTHFREFGMFGEGSAAPNKIDGVVREFDDGGRSLYAFMEERGADLSALIPGLGQLIDARHAAAHAIRGVEPPSPADAKAWVACAVKVVKATDAFLGYVG